MRRAGTDPGKGGADPAVLADVEDPRTLPFGIGGESLLWQPVAGAIVRGLSIATMMTAFIVPLLYRLAMGRSRRTTQVAASAG